MRTKRDSFNMDLNNKNINNSINFSTQKYSKNSWSQKKNSFMFYNDLDLNNSVNNVLKKKLTEEINKTPNFGAIDIDLNKNSKQSFNTSTNNKITTKLSLNEIKKKFKEIELIIEFKQKEKDIITFKQLIFILNYIKFIDLDSDIYKNSENDKEFIDSIYNFLTKNNNNLYYSDWKSYVLNIYKLSNKIKKKSKNKIIPKKDSLIDIKKVVKNQNFFRNKNISFSKKINLTKDISILNMKKKSTHSKILKKPKKNCKLKKLDKKKNTKNIKIKLNKNNFKTNIENNFSFNANNDNIELKSSKDLQNKNIMGNKILDNIIQKIKDDKSYTSEKKNQYNYKLDYWKKYNLLKIIFKIDYKEYYLYIPLNNQIENILEDFINCNKLSFYLKHQIMNEIKLKYNIN